MLKVQVYLKKYPLLLEIFQYLSGILHLLLRWVQRVTTEILLSTVLAAPEGFETERFIEEHEAVQAPSLFLEMLSENLYNNFQYIFRN